MRSEGVYVSEVPEATVTESRCPKCKGEMDEGKMTPPLGFGFAYVSDNWSKRFLSIGGVPVTRAKACYRCGHIKFYLDPDALRKHIT